MRELQVGGISVGDDHPVFVIARSGTITREIPNSQRQ